MILFEQPLSAKIHRFATLACIWGQPVLTGTGLQSAATEGLGNTAQEQGVPQVMQVNWTEASKCSKWSKQLLKADAHQQFINE